MKKRIIIALGLVLALCLAFTTIVFAAQATKQSDITYRSIKIFVDGAQFAPVDVKGASTEPFILNEEGTTYVPVRAVATALGLGVDWDNATSTVILTTGGTPAISADGANATNSTKKVTLTYRDIKITLDGVQVELKNAAGAAVEPFIYNDSTYLPIRAVATALGCDIEWDNAKSTIAITTKKEEVVTDSKEKTDNTSKVSDKTTPSTPSKTVEEPAVEAFSFVSQPSSFYFDKMTEIPVSVQCKGGTGNYTYIWQWFNGNKWCTLPTSGLNGFISGINNPMLKFNPLGYDAFFFGKDIRCWVKEGGRNHYSNPFRINCHWFHVVALPTFQYISVGETVDISVCAYYGKGTITYDWQYKEGENWVSFKEKETDKKGEARKIKKDESYATGYDTAKLSLTLRKAEKEQYFLGKEIRCVVSDGYKTIESTSAWVKLRPLMIIKQPTSLVYKEDQTKYEFTVEAIGGKGDYEYRWYKKNDKGEFDEIKGPEGDKATLTIEFKYNKEGKLEKKVEDKLSTAYYCVVKEKGKDGESVTSRIVTFTGYPEKSPE